MVTGKRCAAGWNYRSAAGSMRRWEKFWERDMVWEDVQRIRAQAPLVLNITNYVVMNTTANALLAIGASPVMAHAIEEAEDMARIAQALVINIGTLSAPWVESMFKAGRVARERGIGIVLDPVGCGATAYRTQTAQDLLREIRPTVVRGNASEIRALYRSGGNTKGVDSRDDPDDVMADAKALAHSAGCVVSVSGAVDLITDGERVARVANGHALMPRVTGMGCTASAITGAFLAVNADIPAAASHAMAAMGIAGEIAGAAAAGPGSFQMKFLDALYQLDGAQLSTRLKLA
jgi:hydroxyethylthiazole kinase